MNLVKWIRKNNRQIMVFVVIFCMVSFVIGQFGLKLILNRFDPNKRAFATYDTGKINNYDVQAAQSELQILRMLNSEQILQSQGIGGPLLCHLIFPDSQFSSDIALQLKQAAQSGQLPISVEQLEDYFSQPGENAAILWILLKAEARRTGYLVSTETAEQNYVATMAYSLMRQNPNIDSQQVMQNAQIITSRTIAGIASSAKITKEQIYGIFSNLLSVIDYANRIMDNQAVTLNQIKATLGRSRERLDAEYVTFDAKNYIDETAEITEDEIQKQFETYKANSAGTTTQDNPFGFGYKLPKRVQLEYMVVLNDDVKAIIAAPTAEEMEQYYKNNITQFQTSKPSDPNDSESEPIIVTQSFTDVERTIRTTIEREKTDKQTAMLFNEIKDLAEKGFENITFEEATNEQLQDAAKKFDEIAQQITDSYQVQITTGKTGWLSADDFGQTKILSNLIRQQGQNRIPLSDLAFIASTSPEQKRRIGLTAPRVWENIGPVTGYYLDMDNTKYQLITAMVRVIGVEESQVPSDVNVQYDIKGIDMFTKPDEITSFSIRDKVIEDIRLEKAMDTAAERANELAALVINSDWTEAIKTYNNKYANSDDPNNTEAANLAVKLEIADDQNRIAETEIATAERYIAENPSAGARIRPILINNQRNNQLYALLENDSESTGTINKVLKFDAGAACYVVKNVTRQPATETDYLESKAQAAMQISSKDRAELALIHFNPQNILKRMELEYKEKSDQEPTDEGSEDQTDAPDQQ